MRRLPQVSAVMTSEGHLFGSVYEQNRLVVPLSAISPSMVRAVLAVEDRRFFDHHGVDWRAVVRAALVNLRRRRFVQGGSTITQQLARIAVLGRCDRTLRRKLLEAVVAYMLELQIGKLQILEAYLNAAYFGHGVYGVQIAALNYFGKLAQELSDHEAAHLAGLLRAPSHYCYCCRPRSARQRTALVLGMMKVRATRPIGRSTRRPRPALSTRLPLSGGYVLDSVRQWLRQNASARYPHRGLIVHTTIDANCQQAVEDACRAARRAGYQGRLACVIQDAHSGAVRALSGGVDFRRHQFNAAADGELQPGSVLKPFVLMAALERGMGLDQKFESRPLCLQLDAGRTWTVRNAGDRYFGPITIADALVLSDNTVYAQLLLEIGVDPVRQLLERAGIKLKSLTPALSTGATRPGLSPIQVCSAYSMFSSAGRFFHPEIVSRIVEEDGSPWSNPVQPVQVCTPALSSVVTGVLQRVAREGTGSLRYQHPRLASKTGTSASGGWYVSYDESFRLLTWTETDFSPGPIGTYPAKGVSAKALADRIWTLLTGPRRAFSALFGAFAGVDHMLIRDLLWVEQQFQLA